MSRPLAVWLWLSLFSKDSGRFSFISCSWIPALWKRCLYGVCHALRLVLQLFPKLEVLTTSLPNELLFQEWTQLPLWKRLFSALLGQSSHFFLCVPGVFYLLLYVTGFPGYSGVKNPSASAGDTGSIPGSGRSPGEGSGNPLQCFCLGSPMDRGA